MRLKLDPFSPNGVSIDDTALITGGGSSTSGGTVTIAGEDYLTLTDQQITANPIDLDNLSATGTPSSSTFLRGDNSWATPAGSGDVSKVGTPVDNQVGVWTGDGTIEGDADLTFDTSTNTLSTVNIAPSGTVDGRDVATDGTKLDGIETGADVTDATNVASAGAFMKATDDTDDITEGATNKWFTSAEETKLAGIETGADVTDATNVDAAGATMNTDTTLAGNGYFLDEDNMASDSDTKVPSQQSVKAYVDSQSSSGVVETIVPGNNIDVDATDPANPIVAVETLTLADISDVTASATEVSYTDGVTSAIQTQIDGKQPLDSDLTTIAGLSPTNDDVIQRKAGAWTNRTMAQVKTDLSLTKSDVGLGNVDNTSDATKNSASATLTNKSIDGDDNTITDLGTTALKNAAVTASKLSLGGATAYVATNEGTSSATFADLTTTTDSVTVTVGAGGVVLVTVSAQLVDAGSEVGVDVSGANTEAASSDFCIRCPGGGNTHAGNARLYTGLNAGSTTFKMKYKTGGGTDSFLRRRISATPLG